MASPPPCSKSHMSALQADPKPESQGKEPGSQGDVVLGFKPCDAMRIQKGRKCTEMSAVNLAHQTGFPNSVYFHFAFCTLKHSITTPSVPIYFSSLITVALQKKDHKRRDRDRMQLQSGRSVGGTTRRWKHCSVQLLSPELSNTNYMRACVGHGGMAGGWERDKVGKESIDLAVGTKSGNKLAGIEQKSERFTEGM